MHDLLGLPLDQVLDPASLAAEVTAAVRHRDGALGGLLAAVVAQEQGDPRLVPGPYAEVGLSRLYLTAVGWSLQVCSQTLAT